MIVFLVVLSLCSWVVVMPMLFGHDPSRGRVIAPEPLLPEVPLATFDSRGFA